MGSRWPIGCRSPARLGPNGTTLPGRRGEVRREAVVWAYGGRAPAQPDCERPFWLDNELTGFRRGQRCRSTKAHRCRFCAETYRRRVRRVADSGRDEVRYPGSTVLLADAHGAVGGGPALLRAPECDARQGEDCRRCPCTPAGGVNLGKWNGECSACFNRFMQDLRRMLRLQVQYFKGAEVQQRGALHFHVLVRLPATIGCKVNRNALRALAMHHGFGPLDRRAGRGRPPRGRLRGEVRVEVVHRAG